MGVILLLGIVIGAVLAAEGIKALLRREARLQREANRMDGITDDYDPDAIETDTEW